MSAPLSRGCEFCDTYAVCHIHVPTYVSALESQVATLTAERDTARARIAQLIHDAQPSELRKEVQRLAAELKERGSPTALQDMFARLNDAKRALATEKAAREAAEAETARVTGLAQATAEAADKLRMKLQDERTAHEATRARVAELEREMSEGGPWVKHATYEALRAKLEQVLTLLRRWYECRYVYDKDGSRADRVKQTRALLDDTPTSEPPACYNTDSSRDGRERTSGLVGETSPTQTQGHPLRLTPPEPPALTEARELLERGAANGVSVRECNAWLAAHPAVKP